ncbi:hypothetical protein JCM30237_25330 [Halolamina litorea]|uniref:Polysaccharide deacetylase n=1 Tax=Halolamina litorea TaxID=1515593 RepID=A0ABD6BU17_9EURY|nr:hypothetical protein [Halolamina litorea]
MAVSDGFTMGAYADLLESIKDGGHEFITVREYLASDDLPQRFVVLRHDVDRRPGRAVRMAELEADHGVRSTYYYRTSTFEPDRTRRLARLGHEVGYHYEDYVATDGDLRAAHRRFAMNLQRLRRGHSEPVQTICMHGNPLSPHDNRTMWTHPKAPDFETYSLLGEAYLSMDFVDVAYFSDTGRTWSDGPLKVKDHTMGEGEKEVNPATTDGLAALFREGEIERACLLAHPERWVDSLPELIAARSTDGAVNLVKRGMALFSYGAADS